MIQSKYVYFAYLKYILAIINNINKMFQSETTEIHNLYTEMKRFLKIVMRNFLKSHSIE